MDSPDDDDWEDYDIRAGVDYEDTLFDYDSQDCAMDKDGFCGKAGSEECDWECPLSRFIRN